MRPSTGDVLAKSPLPIVSVCRKFAQPNVPMRTGALTPAIARGQVHKVRPWTAIARHQEAKLFKRYLDYFTHPGSILIHVQAVFVLRADHLDRFIAMHQFDNLARLRFVNRLLMLFH